MLSRTRAALLPFLFILTAASPAELQQWKKQAQRVTITRDDWGIAHVRGKSDADAVFGMIYAQAEDDFPRIEANYLTALGRTAEAEGEKAIWQDLRARLYVSEPELRANYAASPTWLKRLMDAWAAGLNHYLATHPNVRPRVLTRFEPWMALSFTEGSIGGDIERIDLGELEKFYSGKRAIAAAVPDYEPRGSNGIAIAPPITSGGNALLLINPHTSFFFRSELQMTSDEGLNAYGAATWGQFFVYQGFNERAGWMHTSSGVDNVDEFAEKVEKRGDGFCYRYGKDCRQLLKREVSVRYRAADGTLGSRSFTTWRTHHGPIVREDNGRWISFAMMDKPVAALQQSFLRTKTKDLKDFLRIAELKANSSNNTVFADGKGQIAMLMPQFMPRRDNRFDYTKPVDGSDPATDWGPLQAVSELPSTVNPVNRWVQNTNNWPYSAAGKNSPKQVNYPRYLDMLGENPRGVHAVRLLDGPTDWTLEKLQRAAFDDAQPWFEVMIPQLVSAWDALRPRDPLKARLKAPVAAIRGWNGRWSANSVQNTLGNFWGDELWKLTTSPEWDDSAPVFARLAATTPKQKLDAFDRAVGRIKKNFGWWQVPWGEVNRFQRISPAIDHPFSDAAPSIPVAFSSARWGSLASFGASAKPGTKRWYGTGGNSFVALVEFGKRVRAKAVTAGGESGNPRSKHFNDQAERYATGNLRDVYFYPDQLAGHTERRYRPGD